MKGGTAIQKAFLFIALLLVPTLALAQAAPVRNTQTVSTSGQSIRVANSFAGNTASFEELITGTPASVSITIQGCMRGGTCDTAADTYTTVANSIRTPSFTQAYDYFLIIPTWTGGTNVTFTVNSTISSAKAGGGAGTSFASGGVTANVLPKSNGSSKLQDSLLTDDGTTLTYTGTGGFVSPLFTGSGSGATALDLVQGSAQTPVANAVSFMAPASVQAAGWIWTLPGTENAAVGIPALGIASAGHVSTMSLYTASGNSTQVALSSGTMTASKCVHTDANGNLTVASADCNTSGASVSTANQPGFLLMLGWSYPIFQSLGSTFNGTTMLVVRQTMPITIAVANATTIIGTNGSTSCDIGVYPDSDAGALIAHTGPFSIAAGSFPKTAMAATLNAGTTYRFGVACSNTTGTLKSFSDLSDTANTLNTAMGAGLGVISTAANGYSAGLPNTTGALTNSTTAIPLVFFTP